MSRKYERWTTQELQIIAENYQNMMAKDLKELIPNHTIMSIQHQIYKLGFRKSQFRKCDLSILLEETPESSYWLGFLAADGTFTNRRISLTISSKDKNHLSRFLAFVKSKNKIRRVGKTNCLRVNLTQVDVVSELVSRLKISSNKTKHPLDLSWFDSKPELLFSFIVGYIDGDGSISKKKYANSYLLNVVGDKSWLGNFILYFRFIHEYFNLNSKSSEPKLRTSMVKLPQLKTKRKFTISDLRISRLDVIKSIKQEADKLKLPYMERKFGKIKT